ncbi:MAG: hypothetical protein R3327_06925 [Nitrosopumilaceae archaeon]|nr:hypothetical protein [Nitrosopumilaceae archaeon]
MDSLLDPHHDYLKTEENVRKFLSKLSDNELKKYYEAIEFTSFPILLEQEYANRFYKKNKKK